MSVPPTNLKRWRREFPVTEKWVFLAHASVAPLSRRVADAMRGQADGCLRDGAAAGRDWSAAYENLRAGAARLLNCAPGEIALLKNTSEGLSTVAGGIDWRQGDNVVSVAAEFPANVYAWSALRERGVELRLAERTDLIVDAADIEALIDARTRVVTVSWVSYQSGQRLDLERLGRRCREAGCLLVVDAIQGLGALPLDLQATPIDVLAADGHKWLCAPEGQALFYVRQEIQDRIQPLARGWWSVKSPGQFDNLDQELATSARRYECGTLNTVGCYGLAAALDLILEVGVDVAAGQIKLLTDRLVAGAESKGYQVVSPRVGAAWSGIVSLRTQSAAAAKGLEQGLREQGIYVNARGDLLRFSPHYYNTEAEIERALAALPEKS